MNRDLATRRAFDALASGDYAQAARLARTILGDAPNDPAGLTVSGRLAVVAQEFEVAKALFDRVLANPAQRAATWLDQAHVLMELRDHERAKLAVERALALDKVNVPATLRLGAIALALGDRAGAEQVFHRALALDPRSIPAYRGLCQLGVVAPDSAVAGHMTELLKHKGLSLRQQAELHYALAQVYRRGGDDDRFIEHLFAANARQRAATSGDARARYQENFARLEAAFSAETLGRAVRAQPVTPTPIFIVGMPRSGTTLVEQIIAAEPSVGSGGELDYIRGAVSQAMAAQTAKPFPLGFDRLSAEVMSQLAEGYGRRIRALARGRRFVTDKTPGNYHVLGLLTVLFPEAKFIHVRREPMDTCFSILQQPFDDRSPHTCDIDLLAFSYGHYQHQMNLWQALLGDAFVTVDYETLVASPVTEARKLYDYCGLEWQDSYVDFNRNPSAVHTFSAVEVRDPISTARIGGWRKYATALEPLRRALARELGTEVSAPTSRG